MRSLFLMFGAMVSLTSHVNAGTLDLFLLGTSSSRYVVDGEKVKAGAFHSLLTTSNIGGDVHYVAGETFGLDVGLGGNYGTLGKRTYNMLTGKLGCALSFGRVLVGGGIVHTSFFYEDEEAKEEVSFERGGYYGRFRYKFYKNFSLGYEYMTIRSGGVEGNNQRTSLGFSKSF